MIIILSKRKINPFLQKASLSVLFTFSSAGRILRALYDVTYVTALMTSFYYQIFH